MFARLPFRTKLVLVVSVPLFVLVGFAGMGIASRFDDLSAQEQYGELVRPFDRLTSLSRAVGDESVASAWYAGAPSDPAARRLVVDARAATDAATAAVRDEIGAIREHATKTTAAAAQSLLDRLDSIDAVREEVDGGSPADATFSDLARDALDVAASIAIDVDDQELSTSLGGVLDLRRSEAATSVQSSLVVGYLTTGTTDRAREWTAAILDEDALVVDFLSTATTAERDAFASRSTADRSDPVRQAASGEPPTAFPGTDVTPAAYADSYVGRQDAVDRAIGGVQAVINDTADQKVTDARNGALVFAGFTAAIIAIVLFLALALARSLNRPLRALTRAARDVSERRLPQLVDALHQGGELAPGQLEELSPIRVDSPDEFGDLAKAFNTIQQVTVSVAEAQSALLRKGIGDLYVNLARRNQSLLDRQISLLDEMEGRSHESDQLASLFELDQLATRMRRNAESLLVLAGAEQPRQWRTAVPVLDVARGAAGEIADFARITYFGFDEEAAVAGNAVADVTHLLAELLENATAFSPPGTPVVVSGQALDRRFLVTITDEGIGMEPERLIEANQLLARPPVAGLALSRTLGLHVVGHLAARHGIHVQLRRVPSAGLSAVVSLPATILAAPSDSATETGVPTGVGTPLVAEPMPAAAAPGRAGAYIDTSEITWRPTGAPRPTDAPPGPPRAPDAPVQPAPAPAMASDALPERTPAGHTAGNGVANGDAGEHGAPRHRSGLASRVPGANLTHERPEPPVQGASDARPRPERVKDLLSRHQRGVQQGRDGDRNRP